MSKTMMGPREYKVLPIENSVVIEPVKYFSEPDGWTAEVTDFTELSYFLGYKFEPRVMYSIWSPEGVVRGGHLESRSKLVTVLSGLLYYMLVDMRPGENRGKRHEFYLGEGEGSVGSSVLVPEGVVDSWIPVGGPAATNNVGDHPYNKFDNRRTLDIFDPELGFKIPGQANMTKTDQEVESWLSYQEFLASL